MKPCDWCDGETSAAPAGGATDGASDGASVAGLCEECAKRLAEPSLPNLVGFLEGVDAPVFVANGDARFIAANRRARHIAGGNPAEIEGWLVGDVMDCAWADSHGGCGKSECCRACAIRDALIETLTSGTAVTRKPAYMDVKTRAGIRREHYVISTLKAGDAVLLRMDRTAEPAEPEAASLQLVERGTA